MMQLIHLQINCIFTQGGKVFAAINPSVEPQSLPHPKPVRFSRNVPFIPEHG